MLKQGDIVYFSFKGNWKTGICDNIFCLTTAYYCFMPGKIEHVRGIGTTDLFGYGKWSIPESSLVKEFSFNRFLEAQLDWYEGTGKRLSKSQYATIMKMLRADSSRGRTVRS